MKKIIKKSKPEMNVIYAYIFPLTKRFWKRKQNYSEK